MIVLYHKICKEGKPNKCLVGTQFVKRETQKNDSKVSNQKERKKTFTLTKKKLEQYELITIIRNVQKPRNKTKVSETLRLPRDVTRKKLFTRLFV